MEQIEAKLNYFYEKNEIPHIIFHGNSGTGKKTVVHHFIQKIYKNNKTVIKDNVMYVNCCQGKGIKFIREELKYFAKTNLQLSLGIQFKIIVLLNADYLTIDAQSALRRCIELFSYNTRFFIIVENKNKLLKPILSRFCEIYIPDVDPNGDFNFHQLQIRSSVDFTDENERKMNWIKTHFPTVENMTNTAVLFYENGISSLDFVDFVKGSDFQQKINICMYYYKIQAEFRCEKFLLLCMFDFYYYGCEDRLNAIGKIY